MSSQNKPMVRRDFLRGALATAVVIPVGGALASCATGGGGGGNDNNKSGGGGGGTKSAKNPFGLKDGSSIDAVIFDGGYHTDYVNFAGDVLVKNHKGVKVKVTPSTKIAQQLQPRFVGGNPPDLIDNSGADQIGFSSIITQLETLDDVLDANNYEGTKISDTLFGGVKGPGTYGGKFVALNYVMTVYALWYSKSLFDANGWSAPKTWDEAIDLGAKAKAAGKYLFVWGKEAATYYQTMALDSAIKEGGDDVRLAFENLDPKCWSQPQMQSVLKAMEKIVKLGYFIPGGAGTQFTKAQAKWSNDEQALLYPSGGWIENEMKTATKDGFTMTGAPEPTVSSGSKLPYEAIRSAAGEPYIVPSKAKNAAGGKELLRAMLSKDAASNFSKTRLAPTIVKGLIPADGFGSSALVAQQTMLTNAGDNVFNYQFVDYYGMNPDQLVPWNSFLAGNLDAAGLTKALQQITDKVANDSSVKKLKVTK